MIRLTYFILLLLLSHAVDAQLRKPYGKPVRWAATFEVGGLSPITSINAEYTVIQFKKSFLTVRGGFGQTLSIDGWATLPHALTWNIVLNGRRKGCPTQNARNPLFAELGIGGVYLIGAPEKTDYQRGVIFGLRRYFSYNNRANGFWKAQFTPIVLPDQLILWGGLGIGLLID